MKKALILFVFIVASSFHFGCSSDDNKDNENFISARFNNTNMRFKITSVEQLGPYTVDGYTYFDIKVSAEAKNDPNKTLIISSEKGVVGTNLIWRFDYYDNDLFYSKDDSSFITIITENDNSSYSGSFYGSLVNSDVSDIITVTNGIFDIKL